MLINIANQNSKEGFLFSSELNALSKMKNEASRYNKKVVAKYLVEGKYDRTEETFYDGIKRLLPGHFLQFSIFSHFSFLSFSLFRFSVFILRL